MGQLDLTRVQPHLVDGVDGEEAPALDAAAAQLEALAAAEELQLRGVLLRHAVGQLAAAGAVGARGCHDAPAPAAFPAAALGASTVATATV
jgi:hypothetical protein